MKRVKIKDTRMEIRIATVLKEELGKRYKNVSNAVTKMIEAALGIYVCSLCGAVVRSNVCKCRKVGK